MTIFEAVILGIVEGLTEFLPISSTAHLMLTQQLLRIEKDHFASTFIIVIQAGAIAAVMVCYWRRLLVDRKLVIRVLVAFIPTGLIALLIYPLVKELLKDVTTLPLSLGLGGVVLILFERFHGEGKKEETMPSIPAAIAIGFFQTIALIPGVSRAAATVLGGMALGYRRTVMVEFSFLLAIPTMGAATCYELYKSRDNLSFDHVNLLLIGLAVSFVVALAAIRWLLHFVQSHSFTAFGVYRILVAITFGILIWRDLITN